MAEVAAHLTDRVLPWLPVRQWVLSVPKRLVLGHGGVVRPVALAPGVPDPAVRVAGGRAQDLDTALHSGLVEGLAAEAGVLGVATANVLPRMDHGGGVVEVEGVPPGDHPTGGHDVESAWWCPGFLRGHG